MMTNQQLLNLQTISLNDSGIILDCFSCKKDNGSPSGIATRYHDIAIDIRKNDHEKTDLVTIENLTIPQLNFCGMSDVPYDQKLSRLYYNVK